MEERLLIAIPKISHKYWITYALIKLLFFHQRTSKPLSLLNLTILEFLLLLIILLPSQPIDLHLSLILHSLEESPCINVILVLACTDIVKINEELLKLTLSTVDKVNFKSSSLILPISSFLALTVSDIQPIPRQQMHMLDVATS